MNRTSPLTRPCGKCPFPPSLRVTPLSTVPTGRIPFHRPSAPPPFQPYQRVTSLSTVPADHISFKRPCGTKEGSRWYHHRNPKPPPLFARRRCARNTSYESSAFNSICLSLYFDISSAGAQRGDRTICNHCQTNKGDLAVATTGLLAFGRLFVKLA